MIKCNTSGCKPQTSRISVLLRIFETVVSNFSVLCRAEIWQRIDHFSCAHRSIDVEHGNPKWRSANSAEDNFDHDPCCRQSPLRIERTKTKVKLLYEVWSWTTMDKTPCSQKSKTPLQEHVGIAFLVESTGCRSRRCAPAEISVCASMTTLGHVPSVSMRRTPGAGINFSLSAYCQRQGGISG